MKTTIFSEKSEWFQARKGKITGSRAGDLTAKRDKSKKIGFYELIAEKIAVTEEDFDGYFPNETAMDRGTRLESHAIARFEHETGKKVDTSLILWEADENPDIAISPDGIISDEEAVEAKCLSSARHIEAYLTKKVPADYKEQVLQYFVVNPLLQTLHFIMYDPRIVMRDYFEITINRKDVEEEINEQKLHQIETLKEVEEIISKEFTF